MNKYLSLLLICSATTMYAQNPPEKNLALANKVYEALSPDEKAYCDLIYREMAIHHARELYAHEKEQFIPKEINPGDNLDSLASEKTQLYQKLALPAAQLHKIYKISLIRMTALWKKHAALLGRNTTWPFTYEDSVFEDPNVVLNAQNESAS